MKQKRIKKKEILGCWECRKCHDIHTHLTVCLKGTISKVISSGHTKPGKDHKGNT